MHPLEQHLRYMGSFVDFWVRIPEFAGDMKLICICFTLLTEVVLLLCYRLLSEQFDGCANFFDTMGTTGRACFLFKCCFNLWLTTFYF